MRSEKIILAALQTYFDTTFSMRIDRVEFQTTRKGFEGDLTLVLFPFLKPLKVRPEDLGQELGTFLVTKLEIVQDFNVVKGFLNLVIADRYYLEEFNAAHQNTAFGQQPVTHDAPLLMVEYSSPNTNKPLHLGHIRNNLLGDAVANILAANGNRVVRTQIINDRGIHICKSMVAWQRFGNAETPESSGLKGDQLVGKYYVLFDKAYKKEIKGLEEKGLSKADAEKEAPLFKEAQELLRKWEANDPEVRALWSTMNAWVYAGFATTYSNLGIEFDSYYYESDTYLLGKRIIDWGLEQDVFYKKEDGSVWVDLTADGLDEKLVLRSDGTSVYMTQDLGTASKRVEDHPELSGMVYTVGNEQDYHFKVLFLILKKLGYSWSEYLHHLSYGMVDLPSGKMKSREGTVVDADDLITDMRTTAKKISEEVGKLEGLSEDVKNDLFNTIGLGALKYYILKVDPKKRILFNPEESVDFNGNTGPFIQYTHARIKTLLLKTATSSDTIALNLKLDEREKAIIKQLLSYPEVVHQAALQLSPALVANYVYELVRTFNSFYQNISILGSEDADTKHFRILLSEKVAEVIAKATALLGMKVPDRM